MSLNLLWNYLPSAVFKPQLQIGIVPFLCHNPPQEVRDYPQIQNPPRKAGAVENVQENKTFVRKIIQLENETKTLKVNNERSENLSNKISQLELQLEKKCEEINFGGCSTKISSARPAHQPLELLPVPPSRSGFPDCGPDPDFFELTSPVLVRISLLESGIYKFWPLVFLIKEIKPESHSCSWYKVFIYT